MGGGVAGEAEATSRGVQPHPEYIYIDTHTHLFFSEIHWCVGPHMVPLGDPPPWLPAGCAHRDGI